VLGATKTLAPPGAGAAPSSDAGAGPSWPSWVGSTRGIPSGEIWHLEKGEKNGLAAGAGAGALSANRQSGLVFSDT
jgi:hypothetical protein